MNQNPSIGIFGARNDPHCQAIAARLEARGNRTFIYDAGAFLQGTPQSWDSDGVWYDGKSLDTVDCWFLRFVLMPLPRSHFSDGEYKLFKDWWIDYLHEREQFGFQLSLLMAYERMGVPVINSPENGNVIQLKPLQLEAARQVGLTVPRTLITNDPKAVLRFNASVKDVVYKPSMGGGLCKKLDAEALAKLDLLVSAPVTFQERVCGDVCRLTFIDGEVVSSVSVESSALDYRGDPEYQSGATKYLEKEVPADVIEKCQAVLKACGLTFSGIDLIHTATGEFYFLEANSSPAYLHIESTMGHPITEELAKFLERRAKAWKEKKQAAAAKSIPPAQKSFCSYALPQSPTVFT